MTLIISCEYDTGLGSGDAFDATCRNVSSLCMDRALVNITSNLGEPVTILGISSNCHNVCK